MLYLTAFAIGAVPTWFFLKYLDLLKQCTRTRI